MHAASLGTWTLAVSAICAVSFAPSSAWAAGPIRLPDGVTVEKVDFEKHVMGLLGRVGCNAGACHGSFQGKGGLYLSLFGYSSEKDYLAFTRDGMGRRINRLDPEQSLLLLKPTGQVPHGGGKRFDKDSWQYQLLQQWIAEGARWEPGTGAVTRLEITPKEERFRKAGETQRLKVVAEFADGTRQDVTALSDFRVNDDYVAEVTPAGVVRSLRPGDTSVVVSYRGNVLTSRVLIPVPTDAGFVYPQQPEVGYLDREVFAKLRKLNIVPSDLSSDGEFLRRIHIDAIGCLPEPEVVRAFLASRDPNKRAMKIEELLTHPLHAALWATKFSDITGNNTEMMEQPRELAAKRSKMWHDWFRKRIGENLPYDEIVRGVLCASSREGRDPEEWLKEVNQLDEAARKGFESAYADRPSLDLFWRKNNQTLEQMAEHTAAAFMGTRLECAQCHKHPFDRWTQADYRSYANVFGQVRFGISPEAKSVIDKENAERRKAVMGQQNRQVAQVREVFVEDRNLRRLAHPDTNRPLPAKAPGGPEIALKGDARVALFDWLRQPENPYFARSLVNRVWAHYFGIGLVEPVDSFSAANPPSNAKLLDALALDFVEHKYDIRHLERTILQSRTYQLSAIPNATNVHDRNNYARAYVRRMMAEVVVDVLNSALGTTDNFAQDAPAGSKAIEVAPSRVQAPNLNYVFRIFGRPSRSSSCDCERSAEPALPQTLFLMTDTTVSDKIRNGRLKRLLTEKQSDTDVLDELFLATLTRLPNETERRSATDYLQAAKNRQTGFADVTWALINTREFILNH